jgi:hypothetical protein
LENTIRLTLEWVVEQGWTLLDTNEPGAVRGFAYIQYDLGVGLVPEPAEVARSVQEACTDEGFSTGWIRKRRKAKDDDPALEAALAAHLPSTDSG